MADPATSAPESMTSIWASMVHLGLPDPNLVEALPDKHSCTGSVGEYTIKKRLGAGEFANVYAVTSASASDPTLICALKSIAKSVVTNARSVLKIKRNIKRVDTEVLAMQKCKHAGICQLYDVLHSAEYVHLVMEMGDRDLFSFLDAHNGGAPEVVIKQMMRILALGLRHCHNNGIAHRDIKPENILVHNYDPDDCDGLAERGIVKLCDFGLCAEIVPGEKMTDFVGSPGFFAPELLLRSSYNGAAADMWSLGAVLVEMLLGHRKFEEVWYPAYDDIQHADRFIDAICLAVARVKLGSNASPPCEAITKLLNMLLVTEPERRADIGMICAQKWFELLRPTKNGMELLRLTFVQTAEYVPDENAKAATRRGRFDSRTGLKRCLGVASPREKNSESIDEDASPLEGAAAVTQVDPAAASTPPENAEPVVQSALQSTHAQPLASLAPTVPPTPAVTTVTAVEVKSADTPQDTSAPSAQ